MRTAIGFLSVLLVALIAVFCAACGAGDDTEPPATVTKYYAYVATRVVAAGSIYGFSINTATGALTALTGSPFPTGAQLSPSSMAIDPAGRFAYVASPYLTLSSGYVSAYQIDPTSGRLRENANSPFLLGNCLGITINSTGRFAYFAEVPSQVRAFDLDLGQGSLTAEIPGSPYGFGGQGLPLNINVDPSGHNLLYVLNSDLGIYGYKINSATGELTLIQGSPFPGTQDAYSFGMDPQSKFLYAANTWLRTISAFRIDSASGQLTEIPGSHVAAGSAPQSVTVGLSGKFAYVADTGSDQVMVYTVNATTGALTFTSSFFRLRSSPRLVTIEPTGKFAYVANIGSADISICAINPSTGALTQTNESPLSLGAGLNPEAIAFVKIIQ
jgi:6-phosphogluconolactonase (cycloisomerase 2 family)